MALIPAIDWLVNPTILACILEIPDSVVQLLCRVLRGKAIVSLSKRALCSPKTGKGPLNAGVDGYRTKIGTNWRAYEQICL